MDSPDNNTFRVLDYAISGISALLAALWGMQSHRISKLEELHEGAVKSHTALEIRIATDYTPKRDMERLGEALFKKLDRIEELLHQKADKE